MSTSGAILRSHAEQIVKRAVSLRDLEGRERAIRRVVDEIADRLDTGATVEASVLREAGFDDGLIVKILRTLLFESIEILRGDLMDDRAGLSEAVLALRACIQPAIPHPPIQSEDLEFFRRVLSCDCEGMGPEHRRLVHLFSDLVMTFPDIVYVHDLNGTMLYVNLPGLKLTRFTTQDLLQGLSVYDFIVPEFEDLIETRLESPGAVSRAPYACELYTKDGERIPFELTTRCVKRDGHVIGVIGLARNLRLARRLEGEIRRSNAYVEKVVASAPLGIVLTDSQCTVIEANPAAVALLGAPNAGVLMGLPFHGLFQGATASLREFLFQTLVGEREARLNWVETSGFGAAFNCDLTVVPLRRDLGCVDSLLILMTDMSSQVALQQSLVQSEKLSAIGEIVAGVAHELNNPLTGILGYAQLLLTAKVEPAIKARVEHIAGEAERCRRIVQNLLSFARHYESEKSLQNLNEVLSDTLALREYQLRIDGITVEVSLDPHLPNVLADPHDLQRVFLNIINNAQQALSGVEGREKRLTIRTCVQDECVNIVFADNGPGIPSNIRNRVFDPFFTTKGVGEGTGLGLSVSYGVVKEHGGQILLESKEGEGATFTIVLPIPEAPE